MTRSKNWADYLLWLLLAIGFLGVAKVSYENFTGTPCPNVIGIPICYVVLAGYGLMVLSVIIWQPTCRHYFFAWGWVSATVIALAGSVSEIVSGGGVCPTSGGGSVRGAASESMLGTGIPLCFVSLAMLVVILGLFVMGPYKRTCDTCNIPA